MSMDFLHSPSYDTSRVDNVQSTVPSLLQRTLVDIRAGQAALHSAAVRARIDAAFTAGLEMIVRCQLI